MTITYASKLIGDLGSDELGYRMSFTLTGCEYTIPVTVLFGGPNEEVIVTAVTARPLPAEHTLSVLQAVKEVYEQKADAPVFYQLEDGCFSAKSKTTVENIRTFDDEFDTYWSAFRLASSSSSVKST